MPPDEYDPFDEYPEFQPWLDAFGRGDVVLLVRVEGEYLKENLALLKKQLLWVRVTETLRMLEELPAEDTQRVSEVLQVLEELLAEWRSWWSQPDS